MNLDLTKNASHRRRTKIIATLGPGTDDPEVMEGLIRSGVDVFRLNMSHGDAATHQMRADLVRSTSSKLRWQVALLVDLQGPKIRIEKFENGYVDLVGGDHFVLDAENPGVPGDDRRVGISYDNLVQDVDQGDILLLDDGLISMQVQSVHGGQVHCLVEHGGRLSDRKGLNLQGGGLSVSGLAEHDLPHIELAASMGADYVAVSFVSNADDIKRARALLREAGSRASLVAKIERMEAIDNLDEICDATDAIMVARGDLGVEIGDEELPGLQKHIISTAIKHNRIVATATQMMQSMVENPIPTRAEVLDVANAVLDGTDAVMLSAETASGQYPCEAVEMMVRVAVDVERDPQLKEQFFHPLSEQSGYRSLPEVIGQAACRAAESVGAAAILAFTQTGSTAALVAKYRPPMPVYAVTPSQAVRRRMALYAGVRSIRVDIEGDTEAQIRSVDAAVLEAGVLKRGDVVVITMGSPLSDPGTTNLLKIHQLGS